MANTTIIPVAGKRGILSMRSGSATVSIKADSWDMNLEIENALVPHFDMTTDVYGLKWPMILTGFASGQARVACKMDLTVPNPLLLNPGNRIPYLDGTGIGYLGYTNLVGFIVEYTVINNSPRQGVDMTSGAMFDFTLGITAVDFTTVGP